MPKTFSDDRTYLVTTIYLDALAQSNEQKLHVTKCALLLVPECSVLISIPDIMGRPFNESLDNIHSFVRFVMLFDYHYLMNRSNANAYLL